MHHHAAFVILVYLFFFVGAGLSVWRMAGHAVNSSLDGVSSYRQYFAINAPIHAIKTFIALCSLMAWYYHPEIGPEAAKHLIPGGAIPAWLTGFLSVNPATAGCFGAGCDTLEDIVLMYVKKKWPGISKEVPPSGPKS